MEHRAREMSGIVYPCAACKIQRRKCGDKCVLAPYFPPNDLQKFLVVHKLFGTSNTVKILRDIPVENRAVTVNSMQVLELQSQLATTEAELFNAQANLMSPLTGFSNGGEAGSIVQHMDDTIVLQDDHDLFGL
ncbi:hypothetical protein SUGI_0241780 [Cryptomeria japonica]|nr:hypothetical protein SUGI_0241780 [Cryptomeria japonica]